MKILNAIEDFPEQARGAALAIGNFDGVHRGHCELLCYGRARAEVLGKPFVIVTFEPHPRRLLKPDEPPFRITPLDLKRERLAESGAELLLELTFDWPFASQSAEHFVESILKERLGGGPVHVGRDFRFGQLRRGSVETLREAGLDVTVLDAVGDEDGQTYSASRVRELLRAGDMAEAERILGWPWEVRGVVVRGDRRGRRIGYPTANLALGEAIHPDYGVYAAWVQVKEDGPDSPWFMSATNIGIRPMFEVATGQIEAHILDFDRDLYGKSLCVRPFRRLRGEAKFDSIDALIAQIGRDCSEARSVLENRP